MSWFTQIWSSSVGKKVLVAVTGLGLLGFLFGHIFGNLHLFWGGDELNEYAMHLHEYWFLPLAEIGIIAMFIVHIGLVIKLTLENRSARGAQRYAVHKSKKPSFSYFTSRMMLVSGLIVLTFLVVHILDYRLERAAHDEALAQCLAAGTVIAECNHTIGAEVLTSLQVPWRAALYTLGSLLIGWHLFHGIQSAFRSFGVAHDKWTPVINKAGATIGIVLGLLFASIPVTIYVTGGEMPFAPEDGIVEQALDEGAAHADHADDAEPAAAETE